MTYFIDIEILILIVPLIFPGEENTLESVHRYSTKSRRRRRRSRNPEKNRSLSAYAKYS